jgi:hypothetical protein
MLNLVSIFLYLIFFIYKIYFLNSFSEREKGGKIIPKLTIDMDKIKEIKNEKIISEEIHLLKNKINELETVIKNLEIEVYNLYN